MLQNNSIVVSLSVSQWTARKLDKKITDEVNSTHAASDDAGRYNKLLVAKEFTEAVSKVVNKARTFHYTNTLGWGDNNERLLPSANYFSYVTEMNLLRSEFDNAVAAFLKNYDNVISDAQRRLNGMFKLSDYPSRSEITEKFSFRTSFFPVPDTDFRVQLDSKEVDKLREALGAEINNRLADAVKGIWERINTQLLHMREKLSDSKAVFRDSLFENLNELVELLPKLNVTNDKAINDICTQMKKLSVNPDVVRTDVKLRAQKAEEVQNVMDKFGSFFGK